ncbi:hypothetical protein PRIPAC_78392 [Pristionchus pacificus]|uniref:Uncharacterized protein n=1 Tax=Pristionchus pacificus TaxID=54126 RepID=A0A2A6C4H1_PRIPA|nr:hypothetical protein PRIPAC_78392 [Pristionchus pacificus]|eukprot:PDM72988.1 hypothetical protein PRIPAC_39422 [Pristionchus pacificus]
MFVMGISAIIFSANVPGIIFFGGDSPNKSMILQRSEYEWVRETAPNSLVFGEIFQLHSLKYVYGIIFFTSFLSYTAVWLSRKYLVFERKTMTMRQNARDSFMFGSLFTFFIPLFTFFFFLAVGIPSSIPHVHSVLGRNHSLKYDWVSDFSSCFSLSLSKQLNGRFNNSLTDEQIIPKGRICD